MGSFHRGNSGQEVISLKITWRYFEKVFMDGIRSGPEWRGRRTTACESPW